MIFFISIVVHSYSSFLLLRIESYLKLLVWACYFPFRKSSSSLLTQSTGRMVTRIVTTLWMGQWSSIQGWGTLEKHGYWKQWITVQPTHQHTFTIEPSLVLITVGVKRSWHAECVFSGERGGGIHVNKCPPCSWHSASHYRNAQRDTGRGCCPLEHANELKSKMHTHTHTPP